MIGLETKPTLAERMRRITKTSLNTINRMPQGSVWGDSLTYPDSCDATHPFHFDLFIPSEVLQLNYAKLSFKLRAFRSPVAGANSVSSAAGSSHSHAVSGIATDNGDSFHHHGWAIGGGSSGTAMLATGAGGAATVNAGANTGTVSTDDVHVTHSHTITGQTSGNESTHTHSVSPTLLYGIFEGAVATDVTVIVNGVDRTSALGGGSGFTSDQTELALNVGWLNVGQWNTIDLTPTGLGRIIGHLVVLGWVQAV